MDRAINIIVIFLGIVLTILSLSACSIQEKAIDSMEKPLRESPVIVSPSDSSQTMKLNSILQSSPENILLNCTRFDGGSFKLMLTEEQAFEVGVSNSTYINYVNKLSFIK